MPILRIVNIISKGTDVEKFHLSTDTKDINRTPDSEVKLQGYL